MNVNEIPIPQCITEKILELNQIVEKYPNNIPIPVIADFFGCDFRSVRAYLECAQYSFGMAWQKAGKANRGFLIPTAKFYMWYRNIALTRREMAL